MIETLDLAVQIPHRLIFFYWCRTTLQEEVCGYIHHQPAAQQRYQVQLTFLTMSHGKGEVDRVGGIVKRVIHSAIMAANTWLPSSVQTVLRRLPASTSCKSSTSRLPLTSLPWMLCGPVQLPFLSSRPSTVCGHSDLAVVGTKCIQQPVSPCSGTVACSSSPSYSRSPCHSSICDCSRHPACS